ncbi:MAG: CBS domain-containing protein [Deltaproteobacteria bacterium]|nr:CBS domain-containing protein [Deltaproteobacteria bacterium]
MKVQQWMTRQVITLKPQDSLQHAHDRLRKYRINQFPVVRDGTLVGVITDRDVRDAYPSRLRHIRNADVEEFAAEHTVEQIMTREVITINPEATIREAALCLRQHRFGALPVVERSTLVGIITRSDILEAVLASERS